MIIFYSRFPNKFSVRNLIATALHPGFKKSYIEQHFPEIPFETIEEQIIIEMNNKMRRIPTAALQRAKTSEILLHLHGSSFNETEPRIDSRVLLGQYFLENDKSLTLLLLPKYEVIKEIFIIHNTKLLSSAACERLFSMAKHVFTASRTLLSDERFEKLLLLKCSLTP